MVKRIKEIKCNECPYFRDYGKGRGCCLLMETVTIQLGLAFESAPVNIKLVHYCNFSWVRNKDDICILFERYVNDD